MKTMMTTSIPERVAMFVAESELDAIGLWELARVVDRTSGIDPSLSQMAKVLFLAGKLLDRGFVAADIGEGGKAIPWPERDRVSVLGRIEREWRALGREPNPWEICWFDLQEARR